MVLILLSSSISWDSLAGYTFARVSQNLGECRLSLSFQICRTSIHITTVPHCLANYFLTIPASTGHSLCKPGAAAAAAAVYGVVAFIAKQTLFFIVVVLKRPLTGFLPRAYARYRNERFWSENVVDL